MTKLILACAFSVAAVAASLPAEPTPLAASPASHKVDLSSPTACLLSYDQLAGQDPEQYRPLYTPDVQNIRLVENQIRFDAEVGMLQSMVQKLWGDEAVTQTLHALGLHAAEDVRTAKVTITGQAASVVFADGTTGPELALVNGQWLINTPAMAKSLEVPVDDYIKELHKLSQIVTDIADQIDQHKLKSADEASHAIAEKTSAL